MTPPPPPLLRVDWVSVDLGGRRILHDLRLGLDPGECLGLIGPNGGGKSTFLRTLLGVHRPSSGVVRWKSFPEGRLRRGYVPQKCEPDRTCPLSAREVVRQGALGWGPLWGSKGRDVGRRVEEWLGEVGLEGEGDARFVELSGGQQRRVLLARALLDDPAVLLLDEPTAGVDSGGRDQFGALLRTVTNRGVAMVLVSHDIPWLARQADRIACLDRTLHWHGPASKLPAGVVDPLGGCEWARFRAGGREGAGGNELRP